jgi:hypothetical protein
MTTIIFLLKGKIEKKNQFNKTTKKTQMNKEQIEENNISQIGIEG